MSESHLHHVELSLWAMVRERSLALSSMSRRLRLVTALAVAQVIAAAVLLALRGVHVGTTPLVAGAEGLMGVPTFILWLSVGFVVLAWAYLLTGAGEAHPVIRIASLAAFGASLVPMSQDVGWHGAPALVRAGLLVGLSATVLMRPRPRGASGWVALRFAAVLVLLAGVQATWAWDASSHTVFRQFTFGFADSLMTLSFFLLPVLYLTGAEFAEWAELVGDRVAAIGERVGAGTVLGLLAVAVSTAVLVHDISSYGSQLPLQVVLFALGAIAVGGFVRRSPPRRGWSSALPWTALALIAVAFIAILLIETYRSTSLGSEPASGTIAGPLRTFEQTTPPEFTIRAPEDWEVLHLLRGDPSRVPTITGFSGRSTADKSDLFVTTAPERSLSHGALLPIFLQHFYAAQHPRTGPGSGAAGWQQTTFTLGRALTGIAWERRIGSLRWLVAGYAATRVFAPNRDLFRTMWRSFSSNVKSPGEAVVRRNVAPDPYGFHPVVVVPFLAWLALTLVCGALLLARRQRLGPPTATGLLVGLVFGVIYLLSSLRTVLEELVHGSVGPLYSLRLPGIQVGVAIATLAVIALRIARPRRVSGSTVRTLVMTGIGLQLLVWIAELYQSASGLGARLSIAQGVIILLALMWELAASGEAITNRHSDWLPRRARVLMFCGYIMLVATAVLFFSALRLQASGAALEPQFESEGWPALGIVQLGTAALLTLTGLHLGLFGRGRPPADDANDPDQAASTSAMRASRRTSSATTGP